MIRFQFVLPDPLADVDHSEQSVWRNDVTLEKGNTYLLDAQSGKGKSTFVNLAYGVRDDYSGHILIDGKDVSSAKRKWWEQLRRERLSVVFQDLQLFPELTTWENLQIKNALTGHRTDEQILEMMNRLEVVSLRDRKAGLLSMGQQQRVAIIRALLMPFDFLLTDEPFSHLDQDNTDRALRLIHEECAAQGAGLLVSTLGDRFLLEFDHILYI